MAGRFGVLPNFFLSAPAAPGLMAELWAFARSAYLDNPLPSLFKERLFVHLSRFCEVRYCLVRHVGFLIGEGRPAGDPAAVPHTVAQALALLRRPVPDAAALEAVFLRLQARAAPTVPATQDPANQDPANPDLPPPGTLAEADLLDALAVVFLVPARAARARACVRAAVGDPCFERLSALLAFVRTAHFWTETHPDLAYESDMLAVMARHPDLARILIDATDAEEAQGGTGLRAALGDLREARGALRETVSDLQRKDAWLTAQKEAFQAAMNGAPLAVSLGRLVRAVVDGQGESEGESEGDGDRSGRRCAFYVVDGGGLRHVAGLSGPCAAAVDGLATSPGSLAREHGSGEGWSFPVETSAGTLVGAFAMDFVAPRRACPHDRALAAAVTQTAAIIISRHGENEVRTRAEAALRESEARFRALATVGASTIYRMSPDWREMRRLDGAGFLADTLAPTTGWIDTYIPPDERPRVRAAIARAVAARDAFALEHRVLDADGTVRWTHSRAIPLLDEAGGIAEWFGAATDVTARVRADQRFTRLFQASPAPFLVVRPDAPRFTIAEVNDAYLAATMRAREEVVGRGIFEAYPDNPDDATIAGVSILRASLERVLATRRPDPLPGLKYDVARPDGTFEERWRYPVNSPVLGEDGAVEAIIHNANDVTEAHRAGVALRESEERFAQFAASSSDALWIRDAASLSMEYTSPAIQAIYGIAPDAILGDMQRWVDLILPEDRETAVAHIREARAGASVTHEFRVRRPADGAVRWIRNTDFPLRDARGRVQRIGGIAEDVTEARAAAERQGVLTVELQHRTRNLMGVVRSLAAKTLARSADLAEFGERFDDRLAALARVQGLLSRLDEWDRVTFDALIRSELAVLDAEAERVALDGPDGVALRSSTVQTFALALHELVTNALKYGALAQARGRLAIRWRLERAEPDGRPWLHVDWRESGVAMPDRGAPARGGGSGRELIERALPYQLGARTTYALGPDGVHCTIALPVSERQAGEAGEAKAVRETPDA